MALFEGLKSIFSSGSGAPEGVNATPTIDNYIPDVPAIYQAPANKEEEFRHPKSSEVDKLSKLKVPSKIANHPQIKNAKMFKKFDDKQKFQKLRHFLKFH